MFEESNLDPNSLTDEWRYTNEACKKCNWPIYKNESTGDWACSNPNCEYVNGQKALFEKEYIAWHKNQKKERVKYIGIDWTSSPNRGIRGQ